ncbi:MAG: tetratricopeptide repeat protein [bacterium]
MKSNRAWIKIVIVVAVAILASSLRFVLPGQVAVSGDKSSPRLLKPGLHFVKPFSHPRKYDLVKTYRFSGKDALEVRLADGRTLKIDCDVQTKIFLDKLIYLDKTYGEKIIEKLVLPLIKKSIQDLMRSQGGIDQRAMASSLTEKIDADLKPIGLSISSFLIRGIREVTGSLSKLTARDDVKVFVLGLDGFDWLIVDEVGKKYRLANIEMIRRDGVWGNLVSFEPMVSPMIWTTIATGVTPDVHGITDFLVRDEETGKDVPVTSSMRRIPAIWNITSFAGITTGVIGWFATYPSEEVRGFIVSDRFAHHMFDPNWTMGQSGSSVPQVTYPEDLYNRLDSLRIEPQSIRDQLYDFIKGQIGNLEAGYDAKDPISSLRVALSSFLTYRNLMEYLYSTYKPRFFGVYYSFTDDALHLFIRYMEPAMKGVGKEEAEKWGDTVHKVYLEADKLIGKVLGMIDDSTVLVIVSDHGFKSGNMRPSSDPRMGFGQATDWHRLNGVIAIFGPGIRKGVEITNASVLDVAPTLLYILGLPADQRMKGKVLVEAFSEDQIRRYPIQQPIDYASLLDFQSGSESHAIPDEGLKAKLVSLGYIAGGSGSLVNLANYYHRSGRYEEAIEVWKKLIDQDPNDVGAIIGMSNAYYALGKTDLAVRGLMRVLDKDARNLKAIHSLATIYLNQGKSSDAMMMAERAISIDPNDGMGYFNKGSALQLMGRDDEAIQQYMLAIKHSPDLAEAYGNLAQIYVSKNRLDEAYECATKGLEIEPTRAALHYVAGMVSEARGEREQAIRAFSHAVALDSSFVPAYIAAGAAFLRQGDLDSATVLLDKALDFQSPYKAQAYDLRGTLFFARRDMTRAKADYEASIAIDPDYIPARINLAKILINEGKLAMATKHLETVLSIDPGNRECISLLRAIKSRDIPYKSR